MPDYKKMYLTLMNACEDAINILIEAQNKAEDIYIDTAGTEIIDINKSKPGDGNDCR